jgi:hypothetical protein
LLTYYIKFKKFYSLLTCEIKINKKDSMLL